MESVYFLAVGIGLYLFADKLLNIVEQRRGARFEHRSVIFFVIILALASAVFAVIRQMSGQGEPWFGG
jgi:hypothetical protein